MPEWLSRLIYTIGGLFLGGYGLKWYENHLNKRSETFETVSTIEGATKLIIEQRINLNKLVEAETKELKEQIEKQKIEIEGLNKVIANMAIQKIKDDTTNSKRFAELEQKIDKLVSEKQENLDRELKCYEKLSELARKYNINL